MNKPALREQILAQLEVELATQTAAAHLARDEAISEESNPENQYDTHSLEAAYLAEGQAKLAAEIQASIAFYRTLPLPDFPPGAPVAIGAIVELSNGSLSKWYFIGPRAGGLEVPLEGQTLVVLTPQSPLGRQLVGQREGATVRLGGRAAEEHRIVSVR